MHSLAVHIQEVMSSVKGAQHSTISDKDAIIKGQLRTIEALEERRREEREDRDATERRLKLRLSEAKTELYIAQDESRRNEAELARVEVSLRCAEESVAHLEDRKKFLETHLKKILTEGAELTKDQATLAKRTIEGLQAELAAAKAEKERFEADYNSGKAAWQSAESERSLLIKCNNDLVKRVEELETENKASAERTATEVQQMQKRLDQ
eukprot:gene22149-33986_t